MTLRSLTLATLLALACLIASSTSVHAACSASKDCGSCTVTDGSQSCYWCYHNHGIANGTCQDDYTSCPTLGFEYYSSLQSQCVDPAVCSEWNSCASCTSGNCNWCPSASATNGGYCYKQSQGKCNATALLIKSECPAATGPDPQLCKSKDCNSCTAGDQSCYWCYNNHAIGTGSCLDSYEWCASSGFTYYSATQPQCLDPAPCSQYSGTDCNTCTTDVSCNWCPSSKTCFKMSQGTCNVSATYSREECGKSTSSGVNGASSSTGTGNSGSSGVNVAATSDIVSILSATVMIALAAAQKIIM